MALSVQTVLVLSVVSLVTAATLVDYTKSGLEKAIASAINTYNRRQDTPSVFLLRKGFPTVTPDDSMDPQMFTLIIQETKCLKSNKKRPEDCPFKDDGIVKICTAEVTRANGKAVVTGCDTVTPQIIDTLKKQKNSTELGKYSMSALRSLKPLLDQPVSCISCVICLFVRWC